MNQVHILYNVPNEREQEYNVFLLVLLLFFSSVDMSSLLTRYAFATLKLDILSLRANSI